MKTIHAVYENGIFRPTESVDLPDPCEVEVDVRRIQRETARPGIEEVYAVLAKRFETGEHDIAERHDEHLP